MKLIRVIKASDLDKQVYDFLIDYMHEDEDRAKEIVDDHDYVIVDGENETDLGYNFVHDVLGDISEVFNKKRFFNYGKFGHLFVISSEFTKNEDGIYVDSEGINSGADNEYDLGKFIFEEFYEGNFDNISEQDLNNCFDYEQFGKALLAEDNFNKLDDTHYIQF